MAYRRTFGLPVTISSCLNNYDLYQLPEKSILLMIQKACRGESLHEIMYQGNLEYCSSCFMGNGYYVGIDLINADCECLKDIVGSIYVDGEGEIEKVENGDYQCIMTFTVERAHDMTNWEDEN